MSEIINPGLAATVGAPAAAGEILLVAERITRRFGGLVANQDVCVTLPRGKVHVLLGPNGAGKSTCINMLSGDLPPSEGTIHFMGKDITGLSAAQRSQVGIGRSYQRTNIFPKFTVLENVRLAAQSRRQQPWRIFSRAMKQQWALDKARACIEEAGLGAKVDWIAGVLSHGEQRQLEIAMVLATDAQVMLLDEPLAGMGQAEAERMVELLLKLKKGHAMCLVEHDMDAVFALADRLTVMVNGQVIASGTPAEVRADTAVQAAYLGEEH